MIERTRNTRRKIKEKKWESKLRKLWNSYSFCLLDRVNEVKKDKKEWWYEMPIAESWKDCKKDRSAVLYKNTKTIWREKLLDIKEERKRNLRNRHLLKEDIEEINEMNF